MRWCLIALLAAATARPAAAQADTPADSAAIIALEIELSRLLSAGRIDEYERHLTPAYIRTTADGVLQTRAEALAIWRASTTRAPGRPAGSAPVLPVDMAVHVYGDAAILTAVLVDADGTPHSRITKTFVKQEGVWRLAALAGSRIEGSP